MCEYWIKDCGLLPEKQAREKLRAWQEEHSGCITLLFYTDAFVPCMAEAQPDETHLLEVRCFTKDAELWLHRSCLGQDFHFRDADDKFLAESIRNEKPCFFAKPSSYRLEQVQKLDIDPAHPPIGEAPAGCRLLRSTGGSVYALPIGEENALRIVRYMSYDENGVGQLRDFRYAEFLRDKRFGKE